MTTPNQPGWYADPLKPKTQERRWDGSEWTEETREASVRVTDGPPEPAPPPRIEDLVEADDTPADTPADLPDDVPDDVLKDAPDEKLDVEPDEEPRPAGRATYFLVAAVVVLLGVALLQVAYLWGPLKDDPKVSSGRPVLLSQAAERSAADTAAKASVAFSARSYETYDDQVDAAAKMMTSSFAKEFRQTTDDAKSKFVEAEAEVTAEVAAQATMTASDEQVEVLIFLNQFTVKKDEDSVFTPFRLKVTLIDTDQGWLVSDVDAA